MFKIVSTTDQNQNCTTTSTKTMTIKTEYGNLYTFLSSLCFTFCLLFMSIIKIKLEAYNYKQNLPHLII